MYGVHMYKYALNVQYSIVLDMSIYHFSSISQLNIYTSPKISTCIISA